MVNRRLILPLSLLCLLAVSSGAAGAADQDPFPTPQSECSDVDLGAPGKPLEHVPILTQNGDPNCFAYTTAQLVDAWRFAHGPVPPFERQPPPGGYGRTISPTRLWEQMSADAGHTITGGAVMKEAFDALTRHSGCSAQALYGVVAMGSGREGTNSRLHEQDLMLRLKGIYEAHAKDDAAHPGELDAILAEIRRRDPDADFHFDLTNDSVRYVRARRSGEATELCRALMLEGFTSHQLVESLGDNVTDALAALVGQSRGSGDFLQRYKDWVCSRNAIDVSHVPPLDHHYTLGAPDWAKDYLHKRLSRRFAQPVAVAICQQLLFQPGYRGENILHGCDNVNGEADGHLMMVIGRRWNAKTRGCQFLLRNSYGPECNQYQALTPHWDCVPGKGELWIDEWDLARNTRTVDAIGE